MISVSQREFEFLHQGVDLSKLRILPPQPEDKELYYDEYQFFRDKEARIKWPDLYGGKVNYQ
jgi:hypothetical protein